jgi:hypothetical protein
MRFRECLVACVLVLVGVAIGSTLNRPSVAQQAALAAPQSGRFQMLLTHAERSYVLVTDTATGHTWSHEASAGGNWWNFGVPPGAAGK